jgi:hypothetical protein
VARVDATLIELAQRRTAEAPLIRDFGNQLRTQARQHGLLLARLVRDYPDWSALDLARAIDGGAFNV